jgi:hypothetical protein
MINKILRIVAIIVLVIAATGIIIKIAEMIPKHRYKITYEVGGALRTYIVEHHSVDGKNGCVSFYDEIGYKHVVCGTYEIETIN